MQGRRLATPVSAHPLDAAREADGLTAGTQLPCLQLIRVEQGCVVGEPCWVFPASEGVEIGALALSSGAITNVGKGV